MSEYDSKLNLESDVKSEEVKEFWVWMPYYKVRNQEQMKWFTKFRNGTFFSYDNIIIYTGTVKNTMNEFCCYCYSSSIRIGQQY